LPKKIRKNKQPLRSNVLDAVVLSQSQHHVIAIISAMWCSYDVSD